MAALPRIACFHGGGSTSSIFKEQCFHLSHLLASSFEFAFFEAPFERGPGPGVLPYFKFEKYGPYKTWFKLKDDGTVIEAGGGYDESGEDGVQRVLKLMRDAGEGGEWVAAMGFSQGTRVVGGLLLDQQHRPDRDIKLKFGVLCMGSSAPMAFDKINGPGPTSGGLHLITIPALHLHGLKDMKLGNGRKQLATYFDLKTATLWEIDYHHAMPWYKADVMHLSNLIKEIYLNVQEIE